MEKRPYSHMTFTTLALHLRPKDKHAVLLRELAYHVNFVWYFLNDVSLKVWERERRFLSIYDFR
jgi:hypothetical protein